MVLTRSKQPRPQSCQTPRDCRRKLCEVPFEKYRSRCPLGALLILRGYSFLISQPDVWLRSSYSQGRIRLEPLSLSAWLGTWSPRSRLSCLFTCACLSCRAGWGLSKHFGGPVHCRLHDGCNLPGRGKVLQVRLWPLLRSNSSATRTGHKPQLEPQV